MPKEQIVNKDWRLNNLYKIKNKAGELIYFNRNVAQKHFNENAWTRNIILKSRQLGFTTDESIDMLDDTLFLRNNDCLIIAHKKEEALKIFDNKIDFAWKNFEPRMKAMWDLDAERANTLKFGDGQGSFSSISVSVSGRSGTYRRIHVTEFAKMCKEDPSGAKEIIAGTIPSVPLNGRVDIESTADGEFGFFHDMFWEAWLRGQPTREVEFKAHFYNWTWDKEELEQIRIETDLPYDFKLYQQQHNLSDREISYYYLKWLSLNKDWQMLRQEYPTTPEEAFVSSGSKLFAKDSLDRFVTSPGESIGSWTYFDKYFPNHRYGLGADVSEGLGLDSSTVVIWDFDARPRPKVVARFKDNRIAPDLFAYEIRNGGIHFGTCLVAVERNNHGHTTLSKLKEIYPTEKIYKEVALDRVTQKESSKLGWHTNNATKPKMLYDLNTATNEQWVDIPDRELIYEMRVFDKTDLSSSTDEYTRHYDILIAAAIGYQLKNFADFREDPMMIHKVQVNRQRGYQFK